MAKVLYAKMPFSFTCIYKRKWNRAKKRIPKVRRGININFKGHFAPKSRVRVLYFTVQVEMSGSLALIKMQHLPVILIFMFLKGAVTVYLLLITAVPKFSLMFEGKRCLWYNPHHGSATIPIIIKFILYRI